MKTFIAFILILSIQITLIAQAPVSQIEGYLEVYMPMDTTSTYIGKNVGKNIDTSTLLHNIFVGANTGFANNSGSFNAIFGSSSGFKNTTGYDNSFFGSVSGYNNTEGNLNSFFGSGSGYHNTKGSLNSFFGMNTGFSNTIGSNNSFFGLNSGFHNTEGSNNSFHGNYSGYSNNEGTANSFFGENAGYSNINGDINSFFGHSAGYNNTFGFANSFFGQNSGYSNTIGSDNSFFGEGAGFNITTGSKNTCVGYRSGPDPQDSTVNNRLYIDVETSSDPLIYGEFDNDLVAINGRLESRAEDGQKTVIGLKENTGGTLFGYEFEYDGNPDYLHLRSRNFAGNDGIRMTWTKEGRVGIGRTPMTNLIEVEGTASKTTPGDWSGNSDGRLKKNIVEMDAQEVLNKVLAMRGVNYEWNDNVTGSSRPLGIQYGFVAQDLQAIWPKLVSVDNSGYLQTAYGTYDPMFVEAFKAQQQQIEALEKQNNVLQNLLIEMNQRISAVEQINMSHNKIPSKMGIVDLR